MSNFLGYVGYLVINLSQIVAGAWFVCSAVDEFLHKHYFRFGICVMLVIYTAVGLTRHMIGGLT